MIENASVEAPPKGRLYRAIGATGTQADQARLAVAKRSDLADGVQFDELMATSSKQSRSKKTKSKNADRTPASSIGFSLNLAAIVLLVVVLPSIAGVAEALINGEIGLITNLIFVVAVVVSAIFARPGEFFTPAVGAPIGYLVMLVLTSWIELLGSSVWPRIVAFIALELGVQALWLLLPTAVAIAIGLIKWSSSRRSTGA